MVFTRLVVWLWTLPLIFDIFLIFKLGRQSGRKAGLNYERCSMDRCFSGSVFCLRGEVRLHPLDLIAVLGRTRVYAYDRCRGV